MFRRYQVTRGPQLTVGSELGPARAAPDNLRWEWSGAATRTACPAPTFLDLTTIATVRRGLPSDIPRSPPAQEKGPHASTLHASRHVTRRRWQPELATGGCV
jgi:hypothetical protein